MSQVTSLPSLDGRQRLAEVELTCRSLRAHHTRFKKRVSNLDQQVLVQQQQLREANNIISRQQAASLIAAENELTVHQEKAALSAASHNLTNKLAAASDEIAERTACISNMHCQTVHLQEQLTASNEEHAYGRAEAAESLNRAKTAQAAVKLEQPHSYRS